MTQHDDSARPKDDPLAGLDPQALFQGALQGALQGEPEDPEQERLQREEITRRLPDLELLERLGQGGMGTVWRVRQARLQREVALKVLTPREDQMPGLAERFEREARTLARLVHPGIVAIHDYGRDGDFCWLLMECVEGATLRDLLRAGPLEPARALTLVTQLCEALQYAHGCGVVHRDIKPENVLLDAAGRPKIADFGLAKLQGEPAALVSLTASRQVLGTLRYMAPEQLDRPLEVDHRADLYALGVVIYEMLTGEVPVGRFELPSARVHTPLQLDDVVVRSLEREPARRYQQASEVSSAVEGVRAHMAREPLRTPAGAGAAGGQVWGGTRGVLLGARASITLLLGLATAWAAWGMLYGVVFARALRAEAASQDLSSPELFVLAHPPADNARGLLLVLAATALLLLLTSILGWLGLWLLRRQTPAVRAPWSLCLAAWALPWTPCAVVALALVVGLARAGGHLAGMPVGAQAMAQSALVIFWVLGLLALAWMHRRRSAREPAADRSGRRP